jgi:hypothetical protein
MGESMKYFLKYNSIRGRFFFAKIQTQIAMLKDLCCFSSLPRAAALPVANMQHVGCAKYPVHSQRQAFVTGITRTPTSASNDPAENGYELQTQSKRGQFSYYHIGN